MKILIVEDESFIRKGIINNIDWDKLGFEMPIEASNGLQALDKIIQEHPEVVLLDIRLPKMNGLELLSEIRKKGINLEVIVLSGHDEFEYAQRAMELGVKQYLLKPVASDEIEEVLSKIREEIIKENNRKEQMKEMKQQIKRNLPSLKAVYVSSLLNGTINDISDIKRQGEYLDIKISGEYFCVLVCIIDHDDLSLKTLNEEGKNINRYLVTNSIIKVLKEMNLKTEGDREGIVHTPNENEVVLIIGQNQKNKVQSLKSVIARRIIESIEGYQDFNITVGIGNTYQGFKNIKYSYQEAKNSCDYKFLRGKNQIIDIKDVEPDSNISFFLPNDLQRTLTSSIKQGNSTQVKEILDDFFDLVLDSTKVHSINNIKVICWELLSNILRVVGEIGGDISDIIKNIEEVYIEFEKFDTIKEFRIYIEELTDKIIDYVVNRRYLKYRSVIREINKYVEVNYSDEDLNLDIIASHVNMNSNYISHLYKKETGESLTNYIKKVRIQKSKDFLKDFDKKIYDIAYQVGFKDAHYFTICFKEVVGITPSEYRESLNILG
ncbi:MAG: response regulator [Clostridia bacterium]|nr:response regulator [Clostridia bacterium]